jgi:hypothetical protein
MKVERGKLCYLLNRVEEVKVDCDEGSMGNGEEEGVEKLLDMGEAKKGIEEAGLVGDGEMGEKVATQKGVGNRNFKRDWRGLFKNEKLQGRLQSFESVKINGKRVVKPHVEVVGEAIAR